MPSTYLIHSMSQRHWELKMDLHVDTVGLIKKMTITIVISPQVRDIIPELTARYTLNHPEDV